MRGVAPGSYEKLWYEAPRLPWDICMPACGSAEAAFAGAAHDGAHAALEVQLAPWPQANALPADKHEPETVNNEKRIDLDMGIDLSKEDFRHNAH